jgi:hypothetical protein
VVRSMVRSDKNFNLIRFMPQFQRMFQDDVRHDALPQWKR